ncbi:MAG: hypothetical protein IPL32_06410 [Chloracidobacterium sp.]|nr:hypothetical protein [Chloracidobacterium sp.]
MRGFTEKLIVLFLLVIFGMVVAGMYGAIHNQISYTVSPEYFTKFKFEQFGLLDSDFPERVRASMVGFFASWWMGFPIGMLIGLLGFIQKGSHRMLLISLQATGIAVVFTLVFGLCGLGYGFIQTSAIHIADYQNWFIPSNVVDLRGFLCAGYMHNSAYLGGLISIFVAWLYHILVRLKTE